MTPTDDPTQALLALQREWQTRLLSLWQEMLTKRGHAATSEPGRRTSSDRRFAHPAWRASPWHDWLHQSYLLNAEYVQRASELVPLPAGRARRRFRFAVQQLVDALSPANFAATNPEFIEKALATQGESIRRGIQQLIADLAKGRITMTDETAFAVGRNLAVTPGAVVYRNALIELIQYAPQTPRVARRPLLIVPPCINKYYILDLQPESSFVRYAVAHGHTVFLISWRNPKADLGHLGWDDYLEQGPLTALKIVAEICRTSEMNALGFCVGGTLLAAALAVARARGENPVAALTLLTTLLDFSDTGDIGCLIDEAFVAQREATIGQGGLLSARELAATFSALRANDLIWPYVVANYLKGEQPPAFDLLYWNADSTNLPGPFATWYLRHLYLENSLREPGKLEMCGVPVDLRRLDMPTFLLATREDHIVPWQTAYQSRQLLGGPTTFVLGASGHVAGVVNPPAKNKRSHWISASTSANAADWLASASEQPGSWWPRWLAWLEPHRGGETAARRRLGSRRYPPLEAAPGRYVKEGP